MKNKKAIFGLVGLVSIVGIIIILGLLIWFGTKISSGLVAGFDFLKVWWWLIALIIFMITPIGRALSKFLLRKMGVKI